MLRVRSATVTVTVTRGARYRQLLADSQSAVAKQNTSSVFVAVTLAMFTGQLLYGLAVLILPQYARSNGISQSSLGLLVGSYSAASLFVSPLLSMACMSTPSIITGFLLRLLKARTLEGGTFCCVV